MTDSNLRIGLLADHDEGWIAGVLYLQTVIRALSLLPESQRPSLHLFSSGEQPSVHHAPLISAVQSNSCHQHIGNEPWRTRLKLHRRSLKKRGHLSRSLIRQLKQARVQVLFPCQHAPAPCLPCPWIGWIADFQHKHLAHMFNEQELRDRDLAFQQLIDEAACVVVSSEEARKDLLRFCRADPDRVAVYRFRTHAEPAWFEGDPAAVAAAHGLPQKFLMFPSQYWKHKNHLTLIEAIGRLKDEIAPDIHLVLTGRNQDYRHPEHALSLNRRIEELGLADRIHHLGLLPRMEQVQLMRRACAIVQPSLFEGWSMLVEDCRALGKTVLISDIPVHREQACSNAHLFNPHSLDDLAGLIGRLWPLLQPGPDPSAEAAAREENHRLTLENGRHLLEIFRQAASLRA